MTEEERRRRSAVVVLQALDAFEAAAQGVNRDSAIQPVRAVVDRLSVEDVRLVAVALAAEAVWVLPPAVVRPRTAVEIRARQAQVREWVRRYRLEATWVAS